MNNVTMKPVATKLVGGLMERAGLNESRVNNTALWEDLNNLKQTILGAIVEYANAMNASVQELKHHKFPSSNEVAAVVNQFNKDVNAYVDDVELIARMHDGKSGLISGTEENDTYFNAWERYSTLSSSFSTIFSNSMLVVTQGMIEVQQQQEVAKKATEAQVQETTAE